MSRIPMDQKWSSGRSSRRLQKCPQVRRTGTILAFGTGWVKSLDDVLEETKTWDARTVQRATMPWVRSRSCKHFIWGQPRVFMCLNNKSHITEKYLYFIILYYFIILIYLQSRILLNTYLWGLSFVSIWFGAQQGSKLTMVFHGLIPPVPRASEQFMHFISSSLQWFLLLVWIFGILFLQFYGQDRCPTNLVI